MNDDELRGLFDVMRQETEAFRQEMKQELSSVRQELKQDMADMREENAAEHAKTRAYTEGLIADFRHETKIRFESVDHNLELLAESVVGVHERIDRETADIRREMLEGFTATHAMMKPLFQAKR